MSDQSGRDRNARLRFVATASLATAGALLGLLAIGQHLVSSMNSGMPLYDSARVVGLDQAVSLAQNNLSDLVKLTTTAFGAVAFLVTYQQKRRVPQPMHAWVALAVGLVMLTGALAFALLAQDSIQGMIGSNAIDLGLGALKYARWLCYACLISAASAISVFALDVVVRQQ